MRHAESASLRRLCWALRGLSAIRIQEVVQGGGTLGVPDVPDSIFKNQDVLTGSAFLTGRSQRLLRGWEWTVICEMTAISVL